MSIEVKISSIFLRYTNNQKVARVKGNTVGECLNHLVKQFPDLKPSLFDKTGQLRRHIDIYVNDESTYPEELAKPVKLERGSEYAPGICNALFGDGEPPLFNGNIANLGLIDNLPQASCVEVPVRADPSGLRPQGVGCLPAHLAALNALNATCDDLAVEGALEGDRRKIYHAAALDPLTAAVLSLAEIQTMVEEMFTANQDWLPRFRQP